MTLPAERRSPLPPLLGGLPVRLRAWHRVALVLATLAVLAVVGYGAYLEHPVTKTPQGSEMELHIAEVLAPESLQQWDDRIAGDLLVERFYILDRSTGERYVADFVKGRIQGLQTLTRYDGVRTYMALLDARDMRRTRAVYSAYLREVAPPPPAEGTYVGLLMAGPRQDAFPLNYGSPIPAEHRRFETADGLDAQAFLIAESQAKGRTIPRVVPVRDYSFLLSDSEHFTAFGAEFGIEQAIFLSETLVVDATASANRAVMVRLLSQYPAGR